MRVSVTGVWRVAPLIALPLIGCNGLNEKADSEDRSVAVVSEALTACEHVFRIDLPLDVHRDDLILGASGSLAITDGVRLVSAAGSAPATASTGLTPIEIGVEAQIGQLTSRGSVTLKDRSHVDGSVVSADQVTLQNQVTVTGAVTQGARLTPQAVVAWTVCFPSSTGASIALEPDQQRVLPAGDYGDLTIKSRARLTLSPGNYTFRSVDIEPDALITMQDPAQITTIYSLGGLTFRGRLTNVNPANFLIGAFGSETMNIDAPYLGTVVAPNGTIQLASVNPPGGHSGSFFGKAILVRPHTTLTHVAFRGWTTVIGPDPDGDSITSTVDNCPTASNGDQVDADGDGVGDACDLCPDGVSPVVNVGPAGGLICADRKRVALRVPPGAVSQNVTISIAPSNVLPTKSGLVAGTVYDFDPHGLTFATPATLTIAYDQNQVPAGINESSLVILSSTHGAEPLTDQPWEERPSSVDPIANRVTGTILHFSHDGIGPPVVRVQMSETEVDMLVGDTQTLTAQLFDAADNPVNHVVTWKSDSAGVATVVGSSVATQQVGTVSAKRRGQATITATVLNSKESGNATGNEIVKVSTPARRITVEGTVHIHDDDSGDVDCPFQDCDENGDFDVGGFCDVDDANPTSTVTIGGRDTCVDDEIYGDVVVTCTLGADGTTVGVTVNARVHEGDACPKDSNNGSDVKVFPSMADGDVVTDSWRADTGEGGFSAWALTVRNNPRP